MFNWAVCFRILLPATAQEENNQRSATARVKKKKNKLLKLWMLLKTIMVFLFENRDVLPFTLKLPHAIAAAKTEAELEEIAQLGLSK